MAALSSYVKDTMNQINTSLKSTHPNYSCKTVSWEDSTRGTVGGALSSVGPNITDVRLYAKDKTQLFTVRSDNWNEKLGKVSSDDVCVVVEEEPGTGELVPITLTNYLKNIGKYGAYAGIKAGTNLYNEELDKEISIRFQTTFLPVPDTEFGNVEFNVENYNYQTHDASNPRNMLLLCTTQGAALQQDGPGAQKLFHHAFNPNDNKVHRYWFECERTNHKVGGMQVETEEEKAQAIARGKATSSVIGIRSMGTRFNVLMSIQIPIQQQQQQPNYFTPFGGGSGYMKTALKKSSNPLSYQQQQSLKQSIDLCDDIGFDIAESMKYQSATFAAPSSSSLSGFFSQSPSFTSAAATPQKESASLASSSLFDAAFSKSVSLRSKKVEEKKVGKASAARVSRGSEFDTWSGLTKRDPVRDPSQHITITVVVYNVVAGGIPSIEDVQASVNDLNQLYGSCDWSGKLASSGADFMKTELFPKPTPQPPPFPIQFPNPTVQTTGDFSNCPGGHGLSLFYTPRSNFRCDRCQSIQVNHALMHGCRTCDFDLCSGCYCLTHPGESVFRIKSAKCPFFHNLNWFVTSNANFTCNRCHQKQPTNTIMHGCRACNHDVCAWCMTHE